MQPPAIEKGDLFRISFHGHGHQLKGAHYAVVVSDEPYNWMSTVVVVPFSSRAQPAFWRVEATIDGVATRAVVEQVGAVDATWLKHKIGTLAGTSIMDDIDSQLAEMLALDYLSRPSA